MKYHNITVNDMKNGDGLRVVLWLSGCSHHCEGCHNPVTWDPNDGIDFDYDTEKELIEYLKPDFISGLTLSGGDPLYKDNRDEVLWLLSRIKQHIDTGVLPKKTVWLYTGFTWEDILTMDKGCYILKYVDVLVDGKFDINKMDSKYPWAGSTNQRVIDVQKSLKEGRVIPHESH